MQLKEVKKGSRRKKSSKESASKFFAKNKTDIILSVFLLLVIIYSVFILVSQQVSIAEKKSELDSIKSQIVIEEVRNNEINNVLNSSDNDNTAYIEKSARDELDYAYNNERIFINVSGD